MTKISKYDAKEWVKSIFNHGFTEFCTAHLPEHLQNKAYLMRAKHEGYIIDVGKAQVRPAGNKVKIWQIHPDIMTIKTRTNAKVRKIA